MIKNTADVTLLILCGGKAQRMQGIDKPLHSWHGQAMLDYVCATVPKEMPILISANRNIAAYAKRGMVVRDKDILANTHSPLVGILGGLTVARTEWVLIAPGDTPKLSSNWWGPLYKYADKDTPALVIFDGERQQNLHLLLHRRLRDSLREYISSGRLEVYRWLEQISAKQVTSPNPLEFKNMNSLSDLQGE
ncbi:MAG: NTP transferase domain-containing protein [Gammaproteobacteria bacterium]|nr:NTP transferase domain-containing protein [Gammaproteobacteria bacterium]